MKRNKRRIDRNLTCECFSDHIAGTTTCTIIADDQSTVLDRADRFISEWNADNPNEQARLNGVAYFDYPVDHPSAWMATIFIPTVFYHFAPPKPTQTFTFNIIDPRQAAEPEFGSITLIARGLTPADARDKLHRGCTQYAQAKHYNVQEWIEQQQHNIRIDPHQGLFDDVMEYVAHLQFLAPVISPRSHFWVYVQNSTRIANVENR